MKPFSPAINKIKRILLSKEGFSLLELMIVIVIIGILAGIVGPKMFGLTDTGKVSAAKSQIANFKLVLTRYQSDNGNFPTTDQGLKALIEKPQSDPIPQNFAPKGYLDSKSVPLDPWKRPYIYTSDGQDYLIVCLGADGKDGGEGANSDIKSDDLNK